MPSEKPEFEIKKLKVQERLSEETLCFSAIVNVNGVDAIEARNHGHGGPHMLTPVVTSRDEEAIQAAKAAFDTAMETIKDYVKTLPEFPVSGAPPEMSGVKCTPDLLVSLLVGRKRAEKKINRLLKTHIVFTSDENPEPGTCELRQAPLKGTPLAKASAAMRESYGEKITILNELPLEQALTLFDGPDPVLAPVEDEGEDAPSP